MKTHITRKDVFATSHDHFSTSASELGWTRGQLHLLLTTDMGNKEPFKCYSSSPSRLCYTQAGLGLHLTIFTD